MQGSPQKLRTLVIGSGAREHALISLLASSASIGEIVVAPGSAAMESLARRAPVEVSDPRAVVELARRLEVDLVVVGPEAPLCAGVADALRIAGIATFGPGKAAARLEGSKAFLKQFATKHGIPTAPYVIVKDLSDARRAISERGAPIVVKADGLCAGKGVVVATTEAEAVDAAEEMLLHRRFGDAGRTVILEDVIVGKEASVHAICDGKKTLVLPVARDHKRLGDGDTGPNTGGMGVVAPTAMSQALLARVQKEIIEPTLEGMRAEGTPFIGTLFAGLMITDDGTPYLLEHNVRFGDPECEALSMLIEGDFAKLLFSAARGEMEPDAVQVRDHQSAVVVVLAAAGYPDAPRRGDDILGLDQAARTPGVTIYHAGTERVGETWQTAGGRVLAVSARGDTAMQARSRAYEAADAITFAGKQLRRDIGQT